MEDDKVTSINKLRWGKLLAPSTLLEVVGRVANAVNDANKALRELLAESEVEKDMERDTLLQIAMLSTQRDRSNALLEHVGPF